MNAILLPLLAMVGLVFVVWITMFVRRVDEMRRRRIDVEQLATSAEITRLLDDRRAADNFRNLFELPVLFFAGVLAAVATGAVDAVLVGLAWAFVALRAVHSLVHCTYNRVMHRFLAYLASAIVLLAMWVRLALAWLA
ncbi:MAG: MAPEG family protein [Xanthomonadales bacterium]|nr:MAPEG family protein [Xanthomonadales bacterium]